MTNLLLLDLDGTVRRTASGATFINTPLDQEIIPEAARALGLFRTAGWTCVGVTNQGGVGSGHKTLEDCIAEQVKTMRLAPQIRAVLLCPDMEGQECVVVGWREGAVRTDRFTVAMIDDVNAIVPKAKRLFICSFRKPSCGMLLLALRLFGDPDRDGCLMVGDQDSDHDAAVSCGVNYMPAEMWWAVERVEPLQKEAA